MKTRNQIQFDFEQAKRQADALDEIAGRLDDLANKKVAAAREELPAYWEGISAQAFQSKQMKLEEEIRSSAKKLRDEAEKVRTVAKLIYDAEMRALEISARRTYNL